MARNVRQKQVLRKAACVAKGNSNAPRPDKTAARPRKVSRRSTARTNSIAAAPTEARSRPVSTAGPRSATNLAPASASSSVTTPPSPLDAKSMVQSCACGSAPAGARVKRQPLRRSRTRGSSPVHRANFGPSSPTRSAHPPRRMHRRELVAAGSRPAPVAMDLAFPPCDTEDFAALRSRTPSPRSLSLDDHDFSGQRSLPSSDADHLELALGTAPDFDLSPDPALTPPATLNRMMTTSPPVCSLLYSEQCSQLEPDRVQQSDEGCDFQHEIQRMQQRQFSLRQQLRRQDASLGNIDCALQPPHEGRPSSAPRPAPSRRKRKASDLRCGEEDRANDDCDEERKSGTPTAHNNSVRTAHAVSKPKKKRKKPSYKKLLKRMLVSKKSDAQKQAEALAKVRAAVGGGNFSKMERL